jgi:hypothetical protein
LGRGGVSWLTGVSIWEWHGAYGIGVGHMAHGIWEKGYGMGHGGWGIRRLDSGQPGILEEEFLGNRSGTFG